MSGGQGSQGGYGGSQSGYGGYGMRPIGYGSSTGYQRQMSAPSMQSQSGYGGYIPPQMPIFPGPTTTSEGGWATAGRPRGGIPPVGGRGGMFGSFQNGPQGGGGSYRYAIEPELGNMTKPMMMQGPQMSTGYSVNEPMPQTGGSFNPMVGSQMSQMSQPYQATQQQAPVQQARPQQSFEDFASTLSGSGMTSGQMNDLYQKQLAKASAPAPTNFWQNVGPGGTQNPYPTMGEQPFNPAWGKQTFGFDPRSMAGKQVTGDLGWYYGRDAIGRTINNQGDAVPTFSAPADGFQRRRPWMG